MSTQTRSEDALDRMRRANPASGPEIRDAMTDQELEQAMARAIAAGELPTQPVPAGDRVAREYPAASGPARKGFLPRPGRATLGFSAGLASVAALAALVVFAGGSVGGGSQPAFAAGAIAVAEANPRLLVSEPGWRVTRADEFEADSGELSFGDGAHELQVTWYPAREYGSYLRDRAEVSTPVRSTLLGRAATTVHYEDGADYATMLAPQGPVFIEIRGELASKDEYERVLHSLRAVDVDTWLSAMPASVVRPEARSAVVAVMLQGVPVPPGFDVAALKSESSVLDHYQLGAKVTGAVSCDWLERWAAATDAGDAAKARASVAAMSTSPQWPILRQMADEGGWSQVVWMYARQIAKGRLDRGVSAYGIEEDGSEVAYGPAYATALDCNSQYERPLEP
jgi:hypothetical protein